MQREIASVNYSYYDKSGQSKTVQPPKNGPPKRVSSGQPSKQLTNGQPSKQLTNGQQLDKLDIVNRDRNWIQAVSKERAIARTWQKNWSFLADYDPKGETKAATELLPDQPLAMFSDKVPRTSSAQYGAYLNLEPSRNIRLFEQKFNCDHRKKPLDADLGHPL